MSPSKRRTRTGGGVGGADKAEAVGEFYAQAVDGDDFGRAFEFGFGGEFFDNLMAVTAFGQVDIEFGRGKCFAAGCSRLQTDCRRQTGFPRGARRHTDRRRSRTSVL